MAIGFDRGFWVCQLRRTENYFSVVHEGRVVGIQDFNGNHFYIRRNGNINVTESNCKEAKLVIPYKLVAVWHTGICEVNDIEVELLKHIMNKMCSSLIRIKDINLDSWEIYKRETGFKTNVDMEIISIDFTILEHLDTRCKDELPC